MTPSAPAEGAPRADGAHAALPGARIWYFDTGGSGIPVVLLHAATGSSRVWEHQLPALTGAGFRVIAYDRRGWGRTMVDPGAAAMLTPASEDLRALMEYLQVERFHLVGTAAGAIVAIDFALSYSARLRSLTIANTIGGVQDEAALALGRRLRPPEFNALPEDLKELGPEYRAANPDGARRWIELQRASRPEGPRPPAQPMKNRITFAALATLSLPMLVIAGGADLYSPPAAMLQFASHLKGASFVAMADVGHSAYWEQPERFNRLLVDFLRGK